MSALAGGLAKYVSAAFEVKGKPRCRRFAGGDEPQSPDAVALGTIPPTP